MRRLTAAVSAAILVGGVLGLVGTATPAAGADPACAAWMDHMGYAA